MYPDLSMFFSKKRYDGVDTRGSGKRPVPPTEEDRSLPPEVDGDTTYISPAMIASGFQPANPPTEETDLNRLVTDNWKIAMAMHYLMRHSRFTVSTRVEGDSSKIMKLSYNTALVRDFLIVHSSVRDVGEELWKYGDYEKCMLLCVLCHDLPLHLRGYKVVEIVKAVASTVANINHIHPYSSLTPLMVASMNLLPEIVEVLLECGADPRMIQLYSPFGDESQRYVVNALFLSIFWWETKSLKGIKSQDNDVERSTIVKTLILAGCDANSVLFNGRTIYQTFFAKISLASVWGKSESPTEEMGEHSSTTPQLPMSLSFPRTFKVFLECADSNVARPTPYEKSPVVEILVEFPDPDVMFSDLGMMRCDPLQALWSLLLYHSHCSPEVRELHSSTMTRCLDYLFQRNNPYTFIRMLLMMYHYTKHYIERYLKDPRVNVNHLHTVWANEAELYKRSGFWRWQHSFPSDEIRTYTFLSFAKRIPDSDDIIALLVKCGARTDVKLSRGRIVLYDYIDDCIDSSQDIPEIFLRYPSDLGSVDCDGNTPLMYAVIKNNLSAVRSITRVLSEALRKGKYRHPLSYRNNSGMNTLDLAKIGVSSSTVRELLKPIISPMMTFFSTGVCMCMSCTVEEAMIIFGCGHCYLCSKCDNSSVTRCVVCYLPISSRRSQSPDPSEDLGMWRRVIAHPFPPGH